MTAQIIAFPPPVAKHSPSFTTRPTTASDDEIFAGVVGAFTGIDAPQASPANLVRLDSLEAVLAERQRLRQLFDALVPDESSPFTNEALGVMQSIEEFPSQMEYVVDDAIYAAYRVIREVEVEIIRASADAELRLPA